MAIKLLISTIWCYHSNLKLKASHFGEYQQIKAVITADFITTIVVIKLQAKLVLQHRPRLQQYCLTISTSWNNITSLEGINIKTIMGLITKFWWSRASVNKNFKKKIEQENNNNCTLRRMISCQALLSRKGLSFLVRNKPCCYRMTKIQTLTSPATKKSSSCSLQ